MADSQPPSHRSSDPATSAAAGPFAETSEAGTQPSAASYGRLAKRITGWTSNLVATAIVLLVCLGVGHTLLDWSGREEPQASVAPSAGYVTGAAPGDVEFPIAEGMKRVTVRGDRDAVRTELRRRIEQITRQRIANGAGLQDAAARTPSPSEARLLELTANRPAAAAEPGQWELHEFIGTFPLWVGFVHFPADAAASSVQDKGSAAPARHRRLAAWGMAVPGGDDRWNLYLQETGSPQQAAWQGNSLEPPLPEGCYRTLALSDERGERLIGFAGETAIDDCRRHFDRWAQGLDPPQQLTWHGVPGNVRAEITLPAGLARSSAASAAGHRIQLQLATDTRGKVLGLIAIAPPSTDTEEQHP